VYASRPLSPAATQHSLPSGRYSLLGPDLHRLDRTSLRLAHSFDHLIAKRREKAECFQSICNINGIPGDGKKVLSAIVRDANQQALAYVCFEDEPGRRAAAKLLTRDEAGRIARSCCAKRAAGCNRLIVC
jgi:hypothetical protein